MSGTSESICIVDDDSSVLRSVYELLASDGLEAQLFTNPDEFLTYARSHAVKVAVLDIWMPQATGVEVQKRLREFSPGTRVIIITGHEVTPIRTEALQCGAFAFLTKPFDDVMFLGEINRALG
jgi:FixJ family two-component response regulator